MMNDLIFFTLSLEIFSRSLEELSTLEKFHWKTFNQILFLVSQNFFISSFLRKKILELNKKINVNIKNRF